MRTKIYKNKNHSKIHYTKVETQSDKFSERHFKSILISILKEYSE
jgi:hypothetical protein